MIHYRHLIYELRRQIYTLNQEGYSQNDMARFFRTRKGSKSSRGQIKNSVSIHDCPTVVDRNERIGDWEIDLMIGKDHSSVMVTMVKCFKFYRCRADGRPVGHNYHIVRAPPGPVLPITDDNGKAFSGHESVAKFCPQRFIVPIPTVRGSAVLMKMLTICYDSIGQRKRI